MDVQTVQAGGVGGHGLDKSHVHGVVDIRHPAAQVPGEHGRLVDHLFDCVIAQFGLLQFGGQIVDLGCALAVVHQQIHLHGGGLGGLAILAALQDESLVILAQVVVVHKAENSLEPGPLKQFQAQRLTDPAGGNTAETLDKLDVPRGNVRVEVEFPWTD